jgi:histidine kinase/DNA gyrase B/HSP90-like ATPase
VERLQRLIEELLELARIDAGQERELPEPIAACEIVKAAIAAVREEAPRRAVAIAVESSSELLLNAALVAAKIALANILDNAVKFSPAGGRVTINVAANGKEAVIAVSDNGPEVAPDDLRWLFQRFYQGECLALNGRAGRRSWAGDLARTRRAPGWTDLSAGGERAGSDLRRSTRLAPDRPRRRHCLKANSGSRIVPQGLMRPCLLTCQSSKP